MKKCLAILALAAALCSCAQKAPKGPVETALEAACLERLGEPGEFELYTLELLDSTTFYDEFLMREKVFNIRIVKNQQRMAAFNTQNKPKNAKAAEEAIEKDREILKRLDAKFIEMDEAIHDIAYYDYHFTGEAVSRNKKRVLTFKDSYFTITPDGRVLSMSYDKNKVHQSTGVVIPGYMEILGHSSDNPDDLVQ